MADESHDCSEIAEVPGSSAWTSSASKGVGSNINLGKQSDIVTSLGSDVIKDVHGNIRDVIMGVGSDFFKDVNCNILEHAGRDFITVVNGDFLLAEKKKLPPTRLVPGSSASTSSSSDRFIINNNSGKQCDVVMGVKGDVFNGVRGNVFKNVVYIAVNINYGKKKKLLPTLPRFVGLKAKYNGKCLRLTENDDGVFPAGFLKFDGMGRELTSSRVKFELEKASKKSESGKKLVHIRCCHNNKYLVRSDTPYWIVANADRREEDKSKIKCTLFELERVNKSGRLEFRFRHSQRQMYACFWRSWNIGTKEKKTHGGLCVGMDADDAYTIVEWESPDVQLPKFVALKGLMKNNQYMSLTTKYPYLPAGVLQFEGEKVASPMTKFEMEKTKGENGYVHIRCCANNKYLVRRYTTCTWCNNNNTKICFRCSTEPYLIVAAADKPEGDEYKISSTLFMPEPYDRSGELKFRFCHIHLGMRRYACMPMFSGGLYGGSNEPDKDASDVFMVVNLDGLG